MTYWSTERHGTEVTHPVGPLPRDGQTLLECTPRSYTSHVSVDQRISDNLVRLVQVVFGLVIAQSLLLYRAVIVAPGSPHYLAAVALLVIYTTTVMSSIDWHNTMEFNPYNLNPRNIPTSFRSSYSSGFDSVIVSIYAYALFTIAIFEDNPRNSTARFLFAFPLIFLAYSYQAYFAVSATDDTHRTSGSSSIGTALGLVWLLYLLLAFANSSDDHAYRQWINFGNPLRCALGISYFPSSPELPENQAAGA